MHFTLAVPHSGKGKGGPGRRVRLQALRAGGARGADAVRWSGGLSLERPAALPVWVPCAGDGAHLALHCDVSVAGDAGSSVRPASPRPALAFAGPGLVQTLGTPAPARPAAGAHAAR